MSAFMLAAAGPQGLDPRAVLWPLLLGLGLYLVLSAQPLGRPKPDLGERLRRLDVDERMRRADADRRQVRPLFASRLLEAMLRPVIEDAGRLARTVLRRLGISTGHELDQRLAVTRPGVDIVQFLGEKMASGLVIGATLPLMNLVHIAPFGPWPVWTWLIGFGIGFLLPDWDLDRRYAQRRGSVLMELPTVLEMLTLATSAGMALEQAIEEVARQSEGVVAGELRLVVRELALGQRQSLQDALQAMANRLGVRDVEHIVARVAAAHEQGLPLAPALAAHAQALRERQRLHVAEEGGKASVRMLLPVALLILPALFVVVLVPAASELTRLGS